MTSDAPVVSVIIPAYHSDTTVRDCLVSLRAQRFEEFEVILVNSSPDDGTGAEVKAHFPEVRYVENATRLLPHAARNRGAALSSARFLVFTDPDCTFAPDWLERLVDTWRSGHAVVAGGVGSRDRRLFGRSVWLCKFSYALCGLRPGTAELVPTLNAGYSRDVWERVGPFKEDCFCGDALLGWKAAANGYAARFEPGAVVYHAYEDSPRTFRRERRIRGREFARERSAFEGWSTARIALNLAGAPVGFVRAVLQTAVNAVRGGETHLLIRSFAIVMMGHAAWSVGEAEAWIRLIARRVRAVGAFSRTASEL